MNTPLTLARAARALPLVGAGGLAAYGLIDAAAVPGAVLLAAIALLTVALVVWSHAGGADARVTLAATATAGLIAVPALLVVFFSFSSGGFFPDSVALGVLALAAVIAIRLGLAPRPLVSFGPAAFVPLVGLVGLTGWALLSQIWCHAPGRADVGFDRDLLYLLMFALSASVGRSRERITWAVRLLVLAMFAVAAVALISAVAPDVVAPAQVAQSQSRLAYPLTYWNALGVFCAVAGVLALHLAASDDRRAVRVLAAGAIPVLGTTLLLTYSRGGLGVAAIGVVVYALLGRPRGLLSALIAAGPATAIAMNVAYDDTLLSGPNPTSSAAIHQGHDLALVVLACVAGAMALRTLLLLLDRVLEGERSPIDRHRRQLRGAALVAAVVIVAVAIALGAPGAISNRVNQFVNQQTVQTGSLLRNRLGSTSNQGRIELWTIAWNAFLAHPLDGTGADTFEILWYEHRHEATAVVNAHSLYIETLGDLGIVGLVFVALFVAGTLIGLVPRGRGRDRALYAALFAAGLAWAVHAGVDWDWQMPAVSLPFAALGGLALGRPAWRGGAAGRFETPRVLAIGCVVVAAAVLPALMLASQVRLSQATNAYAVGNCAQADRLAARSVDVLGTRAPPWQIESLCSVLSGRYRLAAAQLRSGLAQDPNDWQLQAALAAATAASGGDARAQAAAALHLNPLDPSVRMLAAALAHGSSAKARRAAVAFLSNQSLIGSG